MITIDGGTGIILHNGVEVASEKMVDEWRPTTSQDNGSGNHVVDEYWERNDNNFSLIGKSMTESSGVFSFPITGLFLIRGAINFFSGNGSMSYQGCIIDATTDNGSNNNVISNNYASTGATNYYTNATAQAVFDVTDISTHKVRMKTNFPGTGTILGSSTYQRTCISFTRIGNT